MEITILEKEISGYIGRLLRENFGRGPGNVFCTFSRPFVTVYITNFLSPMEKSLIGNRQSVYVQKTRDLMMETLEDEIRAFIETNTKEKVKEFYYDWNLDGKTGMFLLILENDKKFKCEPFTNKDLVHKEIINVSIEAEKSPQKVSSRLLNERTLIIIREGILVSIEKELIHIGFPETLKIAKRNLEKRLMDEHKANFEKLLSAQIIDRFVDWNFDQDKSYSLFILKS
ncbi:Na-translocating system protein MpsC family protein [Bacillus sp. JJ1122]|uniref:Na-translocating system protein MpsC family protein n=1 Tax=Bacillus sp. JJ1122 TaxID=3122951 RepID=UPI002FFD9D79